MSDADEASAPPPRANPVLLGHEAAEATLLDSWRSERMPHAWLISGPRGVGKATLAFRLTRFVLASGQPEGDLLGAAPAGLAIPAEHPVFRRVASGGHADLLTIERSPDPTDKEAERSADPKDKEKRIRAEIVVDDARRMPAFLAMTPAEGGWRVVVVDGADEMNRNAANAVLKAVEEPPARSLILLVAHVPGRVLATIRSRCRRLALKPLSEETAAGLLGRWRSDLDEGERRTLARLAGGSVGQALRLADEGGLELYRDMLGLLATLPRLDIEAAHAFAERFTRREAEPAYRAAMTLLEGWIARMVAAGARGQGIEEAVAGEAELALRLRQERSLDQWAELWEKIFRLVARADAVNLDRKQVVLSSFLSLAPAARA